MWLVLSICASVLMGISVCEADIYRSVDDDGVVCYTDIPFNKTAKRVIKTDAAPDGQKSENRGEGQKKAFHSIVKEKAAQYDLDPSLIHAVIKAESNGNPHAVSHKGAKGLMQLMPTTAYDLRVGNPFDPEENIDGGTRYLKALIERFNGDLTLALAAYNAGPKRVEKCGTVPQIPETKQYVKRVLSLYNGKTQYPVSSSSPSGPPVRPETIYRVETEEGTTLFTNIPHAKKYPRF